MHQVGCQLRREVEESSGQNLRWIADDRRIIKSRTQEGMSPSARECREWENANCKAGLREAA
eukprot:6465520-Amphidinium_carterae.1